ncbi:MAG: DnaD domain protein [Peptococcaceae bacterium]|nr:DnaD domain protein [Peptococcaceae bacterium]
MQQGWIKLHRSVLENFLWQEKRIFSRAEAWLELLLTASYEDRKILISGQTVEVKTGQVVNTMLHFAEHWGWSRKKVKGFLDVLEREEMIAVKCTTKYTLITILKWDFYQNQGTTEEQQKNIKGISEEQQKSTIKELKNINNINNILCGGAGDACAREAMPVDNAPLEVGAGETADDHPICYPPEVQSYANNLFAQYRGKPPTKADLRRIAEYACRPEYDENGNRYAMLDKQRAELLRYAFEQATEHGNTSWNYIYGIYRKFNQRGIESLEDAYHYAYRREQGQTVDDFLNNFYGG